MRSDIKRGGQSECLSDGILEKKLWGEIPYKLNSVEKSALLKDVHRGKSERQESGNMTKPEASNAQVTERGPDSRS